MHSFETHVKLTLLVALYAGVNNSEWPNWHFIILFSERLGLKLIIVNLGLNYKKIFFSKGYKRRTRCFRNSLWQCSTSNHPYPYPYTIAPNTRPPPNTIPAFFSLDSISSVCWRPLSYTLIRAGHKTNWRGGTESAGRWKQSPKWRQV